MLFLLYDDVIFMLLLYLDLVVFVFLLIDIVCFVDDVELDIVLIRFGCGRFFLIFEKLMVFWGNKLS